MITLLLFLQNIVVINYLVQRKIYDQTNEFESLIITILVDERFISKLNNSSDIYGTIILELMKKNNMVKIESGIDYKNHYDNTSDMAGKTSRKNFSFYVQYSGDYCRPIPGCK